MRKYRFLFFFVVVALVHKVAAQSTPSWVDTLSSLSYNYAGQVISDKKDNIIVCYSSNSVNQDTFSIRLVKFDSAKDILWSSNYSPSSNIDPIQMAIDSSGDIYVLAKGSSQIMLLKFDANGDFLWIKEYMPEEDIITFLQFKISPRNNVVIALNEFVQKGFDYAEVLKYDSSGNFLWQKTVSGPYQNNLSALDFTFDANENLYFTGNVTYEDYADVVWLKISSDGKTTNQQYLNLSGNGVPEFGNSIVSDRGRFTYLTGMIAVNGIDNFGDKMVVAKYDTSGNLIWLKQFPDSSVTNKFYNGWKIVLGSNEMLYALGSFTSYTGINNNNDYLVLNYDTAGNLMWNKIFYLLPSSVGSGYYEPTKFLQAANNLLYASAPPRVCSRVDSNYISFVAFDESGALKTLEVYSPDWESCMICADLTVDAKGNIYTLDDIYSGNAFQLLLTEFSAVLTTTPSPTIEKKFSVYPAINDGDFRINLNAENVFNKAARLQILDVTGHVVYDATIQIKDKSVTIPIHLKGALSSGSYFIRISSPAFLATAKILVMK